jgi:hypothetical protein
MPRSPLREGWRVLKRAPATVLVEITWRWIFGLAFWAILYYGFREYFASIDISSAEYVALRSLEPYTWIAITARVMVAVGMGLRLMGPIIVPTLIILWTALATVGRAATIRALSDIESRTNWLTTAMLHLFRVVLGIASLIAYFGCGALINAMLGDPSLHFAATFLLSALALAVIAFIWSFANWFFSLATLFTVCDGSGFFRSTAQTADYYREHSGRLASTGLWFAFARSILVVVSTAISLWLFTEARLQVAIAFIVLVSIVYFAFADALNIWRLATYISFSEPEPAPPVVATPSTAPAISPEPELSPIPEPPSEQLDLAIPADEPASDNQ